MQEKLSLRSPVPPNSIGLLRYLLMLAVMAHHSNVLVGTSFFSPVKLAVGLFFALSGYFGWRSCGRAPSFSYYIRRRLRRLLISYWTVILISALLLALLAEDGWLACVTSAGWWRYLLSNFALLGFLQPTIPGVFEGQWGNGVVNGSLWFVRVELVFSLALPLLVAVGRRFRHPWMVPAAGCAVMWGVSFLWPQTGLPAAEPVARHAWYAMMFLAGALCNELSVCAPSHRRMAVIAGIAGVTLWLVVPSLWLCGFMGSVPLALVCFGSWRTAAALNRFNLSYELYLLHFPCLQWGVWMQRQRGWHDSATTLVLSLSLILLAAFLVHVSAGRMWQKKFKYL